MWTSIRHYHIEIYISLLFLLLPLPPSPRFCYVPSTNTKVQCCLMQDTYAKVPFVFYGVRHLAYLMAYEVWFRLRLRSWFPVNV
jgi:hypothetical protein